MKLRVVIAILVALALPGLLGVSADEVEWYQIEQTTLIAGQHIDVGTVTVYVNEAGTQFKVVYDTSDSGWLISETHLWVGEGAPAKAAPGKFPYKSVYKPAVDSAEYIVDIPDVSGDTVCFAAHAVVVNAATGKTETAWGNGVEFSNNWAMEFCVTRGGGITY